MPYSAQQLNKILDDIKAGKYEGNVSKPELVCEDAQGTVISIPIKNNTDNILLRRRPDSIWEMAVNAPQDPLEQFAAHGVRASAVELLRKVNAEMQKEFPSDDIYRIQYLVGRAFDEANMSPAPMSADGLMQRYRTLRTER